MWREGCFKVSVSNQPRGKGQPAEQSEEAQPRAPRRAHGLHFFPSPTNRSPGVRPRTHPGPQGRMGQDKNPGPRHRPGVQSLFLQRGKQAKVELLLRGASRSTRAGSRQNIEQTPPGKHMQAATCPFHPHEMFAMTSAMVATRQGRNLAKGTGVWEIGLFPGLLKGGPRHSNCDPQTLTQEPCIISCPSIFAPPLSPHHHAPCTTITSITVAIATVAASPSTYPTTTAPITITTVALSPYTQLWSPRHPIPATSASSLLPFATVTPITVTPSPSPTPISHLCLSHHLGQHGASLSAFQISTSNHSHPIPSTVIRTQFPNIWIKGLCVRHGDSFSGAPPQ